ncbi:signal peptidase II [Micromonospora sp. NBC_00898]|uniref:signal peptidase II n=1 Tax=Micromonospora sp. NBC_00898 TaxID=2975981 RepID=UPI00386FB339|nr:signal peptidase II [Micromonospora sp. NBC_00898]
MWAAEPGNWVALGLIAGSAAGNLADRLVRAAGVGHREVVDFLNLDWWPTFNRADSAPVRGVAVSVLLSLRNGPLTAAPSVAGDAAHLADRDGR